MTEEDYFNPFPGLRAFEEDEEYLFFGREKQIDDLLEKLGTTHFLAVVGASGSGKSSLVKSGLLPSLHSGFLKGVGTGWRIGVFRPGEDPIGNLAACFCCEELIGEGSSEEEFNVKPIIETILRRSEYGINNIVDQFLKEIPDNILLVVDQFEELFRFSKYEKKSKKGTRDSVEFINLLLGAIKERNRRVYIVFTMRSDFLGNCTEFRGLVEAINKGQYLIPRMTREERKLAITGPVMVSGASISPQLVTTLLNEVGDNPDQLPILQHALMRTCDYWNKNALPDEPIDVKHYLAIGKTEAALSNHADEAYDELEDEKTKALCAAMFKALTEVGTTSGGVRRPIKFGELRELLGVNKNTLIKIIDVFRQAGRSFLMPPISVQLTDDAVIDISHESLMRVWKRLDFWFKEENDSAETYKGISRAASLYEEGKGGLYRDPELQLALQWREKYAPTEIWAHRYDVSFVRTMNFLDQSKEQFAFEIEQKEIEHQKKLKRTRMFMVLLSFAFIFAVGLSIYSHTLKKEANSAKEIALNASVRDSVSRYTAEVALRAANDSKIKADTSAAQATRASRRDSLSTIAAGLSADQAMNALFKAGISEKKAVKASYNDSISTFVAKQASYRDSLSKIAAHKLKNQALAKNLAYEALGLLDQKEYKAGKNKALEAYNFNKEGKGPNHVNDIYNAISRAFFESDSKRKQQMANHSSSIRSVIAHPKDPSLVISADEEGNIITSRVNEDFSIEQVSKFSGYKGRVRSLSFSSSGKYTLVGSFDGTLTLYEENQFKSELSLGKGIITNTYNFRNNNIDYFLLSTTSGITLCKINENESRLELVDVSGVDLSSEMAICSDGKFLCSKGNVLSVYDFKITAGKLECSNLKKIELNKDIISVISLSKGNKYLGIGTKNGKVYKTRLSDLKSILLLNSKTDPLVSHQSGVTALKFIQHKNKLFIVSASYDNSAYLIDLTSTNKKDETIKISGHSSWIYDIGVSADGSYFYTAGNKGKLKFWIVNIKDMVSQLSEEK